MIAPRASPECLPPENSAESLATDVCRSVLADLSEKRTRSDRSRYPSVQSSDGAGLGINVISFKHEFSTPSAGAGGGGGGGGVASIHCL